MAMVRSLHHQRFILDFLFQGLPRADRHQRIILIRVKPLIMFHIVLAMLQRGINSIRIPLDGINMKIIMRFCRFQLAAVGSVLAVYGVMDSTVDAAGLFSDKLHDVDLPAGWPTDP